MKKLFSLAAIVIFSLSTQAQETPAPSSSMPGALGKIAAADDLFIVSITSDNWMNLPSTIEAKPLRSRGFSFLIMKEKMGKAGHFGLGYGFGISSQNVHTDAVFYYDDVAKRNYFAVVPDSFDLETNKLSLNFIDRAKNILCDHLAGGFEFLPTSSLRLTVEGFYKQYSNYPVSLSSEISLANLGNDFGVIGNEAVTSQGKGRSYGLEFFLQQKLKKDYYITASYTFFYSQFAGIDGKFIASSWDTRNLISLIAGKKFKKGWELGLKYRLSGGAPYTPFDLSESQRTYTITGQGVSDFSKLNSERLPTFNQLDVRIDKKFNFKRTSLNIYLDFQNALLSKSVSKDYYTFKRNADNTAFETTDGQPLKADGSNAIPILLENVDKNFTPALGVIFQF